MTGDRIASPAGEAPAACNDDAATAEAPCTFVGEVEIRLAGIMATVRDVAAAAEELLREASMPRDARNGRATAPAAIGCAPFLLEASRVQITALTAMMQRGHLAAA